MAKGGKKRGPKVKQAPLAKKTPRISSETSPESSVTKKPVWQLGIIDFEGPWGWKKIKSISVLDNIYAKLASFETMTWKQIDGPSHFISVSKLCKEAKKRLSDIQQEDRDELYSLRLTGEKRVWGIREQEIFKILWWDPNHAVCPSFKNHT